MIFLGTPFAAVYGVQCWRRGMRSPLAVTALVIALVEALAFAWLMVVSAMR
ncbi:MAG TPA: hypothetical protein VFD82_24630 [Planctomycetota bacterium]|nr:hypothetical protein [Planctomycetota bacterium]